MAEFKRGLLKEFQEEEAFREEQEKLKAKHDIEDENVVVVEKTNFAKFSVTTLIRLIKLIATILILALAAIGLTALLYPECRMALFSIFNATANQVNSMIS